MRQISRALGLGVAFVVLAAAPVSMAQEKKTTKSDTKTKSKSGGEIRVGEGKDGKFRFSVYNAEGKYLASSLTGYASKDDALKAVDSLKEVLASAKVVDVKKTEKDK